VQGLIQHRADTDPEYQWQTITQDQLLLEGDCANRSSRIGGSGIFDGNLVEVLLDSLLQVKEYTFVDETAGTRPLICR
jgi:hypothetical protein